MKSTIISLLTVGCTFGAALLGILVRYRLPAHHLEGESKIVSAGADCRRSHAR